MSFKYDKKLIGKKMNWDKISSNFNPNNGHLVGNFPSPTLDFFPLLRTSSLILR